ncbi:MAG: hypothetical protein WBV73_05480 [Phormidium sp.]
MLAYHPVGFKELGLISSANFEAFPFPFPSQPIINLILDLEYAKKIARDWNTKSNGCASSFVTQFEVNDSYVKKFSMQPVGNKNLPDLSITAEELTELNRHITGEIKVVDAYYGDDFCGEIDPKTNLPKSL